jgi:hypothetical protein
MAMRLIWFAPEPFARAVGGVGWWWWGGSSGPESRGAPPPPLQAASCGAWRLLLRQAASAPPSSMHNNRKISPIQDARNCKMEIFAEFLVRCVLDCGYPLSPPAEGGASILGFGLGVAQPGRRAAARGAPPPQSPAPANLFCAVAGRERTPGPTRRAKWAKTYPYALCAQLGAASHRWLRSELRAQPAFIGAGAYIQPAASNRWPADARCRYWPSGRIAFVHPGARSFEAILQRNCLSPIIPRSPPPSWPAELLHTPRHQTGPTA